MGAFDLEQYRAVYGQIWRDAVDGELPEDLVIEQITLGRPSDGDRAPALMIVGFDDDTSLELAAGIPSDDDMVGAFALPHNADNDDVCDPLVSFYLATTGIDISDDFEESEDLELLRDFVDAVHDFEVLCELDNFASWLAAQGVAVGDDVALGVAGHDEDPLELDEASARLGELAIALGPELVGAVAELLYRTGDKQMWLAAFARG